MLEARVKPTHFMNTVQAFSGREYVKTEWREVPEDSEQQALIHVMLEVREVGTEKVLSEFRYKTESLEPVESIDEPVETPTDETGIEQPATPKRTRRKKTEDE